MTMPGLPAYALDETSTAQFLVAYEREHDKTRRLLHAFPGDQSAFRPHERSNTAHHLGWIFVTGEGMMRKALKGEPLLGGGFPAAPDDWSTILERFDAGRAEIVDALQTASAADLKPVTFFSGPKQTVDYPAMEFLWFLLFDQIHHRGQFSVYVRMTGGKVPSIYGPSADEPWF